MQDVYYDDYAEGDSPKGLRRWVSFYVKWGGAVLSLAVLVLIIVWAYRLGVRDAREVPVIRAMEGPVRVQPEDPGGTQVANQGLEVNEILAGSAARPPSETQRAPATLRLQPEDTPAVAEPDESETAALEVAPEADASASVAMASPEEAQEDGAGLAEVPEDGGAVAVLRPRSRPATLLQPQPAEADSAPAEIREAAASSGSSVDPDTLPAGTRLVQLGAFDSPELAELQWVRLVGGHSDLLGSKQYYVQRAESNGRIFYRLRVLGFEDRNAQRAICEALRARSVDCIPVTVR